MGWSDLNIGTFITMAITRNGSGGSRRTIFTGPRFVCWIKYAVICQGMKADSTPGGQALPYWIVKGVGTLQTGTAPALVPQTYSSVVPEGRSAGTVRFTCWTPVSVGAGPA
jgi:hypothetical protein